LHNWLTVIFLKKTKKTGFLNPLLYSHSDALTDITDGCNSGCIDTGFCAQSGWDPVTGYGVVNYPKLAQAALELSP
jgi:tripeptidyl-peptidase-1